MKPRMSAGTHSAKANATPNESDYAALDAWAKTLKFEDGRPLTAAEIRKEARARSVGRSAKPDSAKAKRVKISMAPSLRKAAGIYAKRTGRTLSGLIAESLVEKIKSKTA